MFVKIWNELCKANEIFKTLCAYPWWRWSRPNMRENVRKIVKWTVRNFPLIFITLRILRVIVETKFENSEEIRKTFWKIKKK